MKILIVGGGMGGTILANNLARRLAPELRSGKVQIGMLSASDKHMYQPGLLYLCLGRMTPDELYRDQASLLEPGIDFKVDPVETFELDQNRVKTKSGATYGYDILVIATGSRAVPDMIPGLAENAETFYTEESAVKMFKRLQTFQGGRVHTLENVAKWAAPEMDRLGITYETLFNMKQVDGANKVVKSEEGSEAKYDLLITIPAHKGMEVIEKNKLGAGGFIPTNKTQLTMEGRKNVYVIGDTTNIPISKAGSTVHYQCETLGENIAAIVKLGAPVREHDGKVFCFIEVGKDRATYAQFNYTTPPDPKPPTKAVHWFKMAYNKLYWTTARGLL